MNTPSTVEVMQRVRVLQRAVTALSISLLLTVGGIFWLAARPIEPAAELTVRRLTLVDETGRMRGLLSANETETHLWLFPPTNTGVLVNVSASANSYAFSVESSRGPAVLLVYGASSLTGPPTGSSLTLSAAPGITSKSSVRLDAEVGTAAVTVEDGAGYHSVLGQLALTTTATGEQSTPSAASLTFLDPQGKVISRRP